MNAISNIFFKVDPRHESQYLNSHTVRELREGNDSLLIQELKDGELVKRGKHPTDREICCEHNR